MSTKEGGEDKLLYPKSTKFFTVKKLKLTKTEERYLKHAKIQAKLEAIRFHCFVNNKEMYLHCFYRPSTTGNTKNIVFTLHGYGYSSNHSHWCVMADRIFNENYNVLNICLPGYGLSSGRTLQTSWYKRYQPLILKELIRTFGKKAKVTLMAQCGGGGISIRTISEYPECFRSGGHFFGRPYNSEMPKNLIKILIKNKMTLYVWWQIDPDHQTCTPSFVWYKKYSKSHPKRVKFTPVPEKSKQKWLGYGKFKCKKDKFSRTTYASYYEPSHECVEELKIFFKVK